ncbi:MAG: DUF348 domain-containing protein [Candidatus Eremiobacteraeota bacterium]|nr:DUF348 domain-containing protein [Candidatus Eremiobacteraeota bacterium]
MIVNDQKAATLVASSFLAIGLLFSCGGLALAADAPVSASPDGHTVTVVDDGAESTFFTQSYTVGDLLKERGIAVSSGDYVSPAATSPVVDGSRIVVRTAVPVQLKEGASVRVVRSAAATVGDLLNVEHIRLRGNEQISPPVQSQLLANETIRVVQVRSWTARERVAIVPKVVQHTDGKMPLGKTETVSNGVAGVRETTVRYTRHDDGRPTRTILATRIVREPRAKVIVRGLAAYASLARVATQGFESAVHMAGSALHMIATAYTAGCYGCSGQTASGIRAGFGVIAVDPSLIPLGTKVFIPGYGRAVAGDTGGSIQGHRIDLGFDSESAALHFGRRTVTLYVLR